MPKRLQKELENIKKRILSLGGMVEERLRMANKAIESRDRTLANQIVKTDYEIDELEVEVEEECMKNLKINQHVAVDLRFLVAVIKINNDLERIGDQAVNIAQRVENISKRPRVDLSLDYEQMAEKAASMLRMSLDSLVNLDLDLAFQVLTLDDDVDHMAREVYDYIKGEIRKKPDAAGYLINYLFISRHLERIGDHSTNIAEEVIYLIEGEIVRHGRWDVAQEGAQT
jgi:phosphate transport system protein